MGIPDLESSYSFHERESQEGVGTRRSILPFGVPVYNRGGASKGDKPSGGKSLFGPNLAISRTVRVTGRRDMWAMCYATHPSGNVCIPSKSAHRVTHKREHDSLQEQPRGEGIIWRMNT